MNPTERFTERAGDYAAARPSYPDAAIDALFEGIAEPSQCTVVDLGAGTGISSRLLAARGAQVIAIEPNAAMATQGACAANLRLHAATAERTGLAGASADLVTAFQAFHWFDRSASIAEMLRLLRPGGRAAIVYNERDERDPFTAAYGAIVRRYATEETERLRANARGAFERDRAWGSIRITDAEHAHRLDRAGLHARARSTSYLPHENASARALHADLDTLFDRYANGAVVFMRMLATVSIATPPS
ncbi:MAG TPA: class I SAM-dependent methyltransferase [Candidatus Dormibacteraeota bacterium]|nr:class I SAM-dependent methyltransferase [Candidatus Dormibacteraeota bacterium]